MDDKKAQKVAMNLLKLARTTVAVNMRYMDAAVNAVELRAGELSEGALSTDGEIIIFDAKRVVENFQREHEPPVRDMMHLLMHCIFRHFFVGASVDRRLWGLACDIAVENVMRDIYPAVFDEKQHKLLQLCKEVPDMTAEALYRYFREHPPSDELFGAFGGDSHELWYKSGKLDIPGMPRADEGSQLAERWKDISESVRESALASGQGSSGLGTLTRQLGALNRERYDYTEFLKKFAVRAEVMKINPDEFDQIFYTYGLELYEKMPLVEPLEYKDDKLISDFVIAIDTSGSTEGELVRTFLNKTYNILNTCGSFRKKMRLHIIQCDDMIREDTTLTSVEEFNIFVKDMKLRGMGGTDLRPVFMYVDELIKRGAFNDLKGLIYFTDGFGTFPERKPSYHTAFVMIDNSRGESELPDVPSWAIRLVLQPEDIKEDNNEH